MLAVLFRLNGSFGTAVLFGALTLLLDDKAVLVCDRCPDRSVLEVTFWLDWFDIFLQYFDTVGWVFWPVKTVSPYNLYCVGGDVKHCSLTGSMSATGNKVAF